MCYVMSIVKQEQVLYEVTMQSGEVYWVRGTHVLYAMREAERLAMAIHGVHDTARQARLRLSYSEG